MNSSLRLQGRIALVTGSTSGIGLAIADRLAQDGAKVIVSSRKESNVKNTVKRLKEKGYEVTGINCNIGNKTERRDLVKEAEKLGGLDILVQCAGINPVNGSILDCPEDVWDKIFHGNLKSTFLLTQEVFHLLKESKFGRVIYNGSVSAYLPYESLGAYPVSKAALLALTKQTALHLGHWNVTCNCVIPGIIETSVGNVLQKDKNVQELIRITSAIKRAGKPEEVSGLVAFLASDEAAYITGEGIVISGGFISRL